jgi:hypothetical protein
MNVDERIAELTQRMLRRKFYAVLSQPSATPEKLKALLPASPTRRSIAPTALCAPVILPDLRAFRGVRQVRSDREVLQLRLEGFFYLLGIRPLLGCSAYRTSWITPAPRNLRVAAKVVRDRTAKTHVGKHAHGRSTSSQSSSEKRRLKITSAPVPAGSIWSNHTSTLNRQRRYFLSTPRAWNARNVWESPPEKRKMSFARHRRECSLTTST